MTVEELSLWLGLLTLVLLLGLDVYGFYVARKASKEIDAVGKMREDAILKIEVEFSGIKDMITEKFEKYDEKIIETFGMIEETKEHAGKLMEKADEMLDPALAVDVGEGIVLRTLESLGMQSLKDLGRKGVMIKNARTGLQVAGDSLAKGMGINEILEKFAPIGEKVAAGSDLMGAFGDSPLLQLGMQFLGMGGDKKAPPGKKGSEALDLSK